MLLLCRSSAEAVQHSGKANYSCHEREDAQREQEPDDLGNAEPHHELMLTSSGPRMEVFSLELTAAAAPGSPSHHSPEVPRRQSEAALPSKAASTVMRPYPQANMAERYCDPIRGDLY